MREMGRGYGLTERIEASSSFISSAVASSDHNRARSRSVALTQPKRSAASIVSADQRSMLASCFVNTPLLTAAPVRALLLRQHHWRARSIAVANDRSRAACRTPAINISMFKSLMAQEPTSETTYNISQFLIDAEEEHHEKGAELETKDYISGQTPLSWAAWNGHEAVVELLLEKGAELETKSISGRTPVSYTAWYGHEAVVKLLLEKGAKKLQ
jgi:hypothetical protein